MKGTVDRIEGDLVVCQMEDKSMKEIELSSFPERPKTGTRFQEEEEKITILLEETVQQKEKIDSLFQKLKKNKETV